MRHPHILHQCNIIAAKILRTYSGHPNNHMQLVLENSNSLQYCSNAEVLLVSEVTDQHKNTTPIHRAEVLQVSSDGSSIG
jgi:hypothetical protein